MNRTHTTDLQQMSLGGFAPPPQTDRLFFAIHPDAEAVRRIVELTEAVRAKHHLRGNPMKADRVHVTLHHLGDHAGLPESLLAVASEAAADMANPPFEVAFDCVASFPGRAHKRPCVLRAGNEDANAPLRAFQRALGERLRAKGLERYIERRFTPHTTLLYDERTLAPETAPLIGWNVRRFALVHSLIGRSEHRVLASWQLDGVMAGRTMSAPENRT